MTDEKIKELAEAYVMREDVVTSNDGVPFADEVKQGYIDGYKDSEKEHSAEIDVLKRELQAERSMRQYWHDEYCKAVSKK